MLIKANLSWNFFTEKEYLVFSGFYDSAQYWNTIAECFVEHSALDRVITALTKESQGVEHREWKDGELHVTHGELSFTIQPEVIQVGEEYLNSFKLIAGNLTLNPFFNYDAFIDERMFSFPDIYEAVLHGINSGLASGFNNLKSINGLSPVEYAWKYTQELPG